MQLALDVSCVRLVLWLTQRGCCGAAVGHTGNDGGFGVLVFVFFFEIFPAKGEIVKT